MNKLLKDNEASFENSESHNPKRSILQTVCKKTELLTEPEIQAMLRVPDRCTLQGCLTPVKDFSPHEFGGRKGFSQAILEP